MSQDISLIWENTLQEVKLSVSPAVFQTLFSLTKLTELSTGEQKATIDCPSSYIADLLQRRHQLLITTVLEHQAKTKINLLSFRVVRQKQATTEVGPLFENPSPSLPTPQASHRYDPRTGLHPRYTFATFVVGNSNNFAYAASQGIIRNPGSAYNPFFVWGGVGVGKTHLVQALGHEIWQNDKQKKILYTTAEGFTNELVGALREKNITQFKQKYRQPDVFIVDDIQFVAGKEYVQEEFFHTFNTLYLAEKQVILTSDRKPEEIHPVAERLISRFMGGLVVDIQPPDFEMRVAILKQKSQERKTDLPEEVVSFIAETVQSNTREMEGILSQVIALAESRRQKLALPLVKEFFGIRTRHEKRKVHYRRVLASVAKTFQVKTKDLCGKTRKKEIALARHVAAYLLRKELAMPLQQVGQLLGGRDHTTIMHAEEKIDRAFSTNQQIRHQIIEVQKLIYE